MSKENQTIPEYDDIEQAKNNMFSCLKATCQAQYMSKKTHDNIEKFAITKFIHSPNGSIIGVEKDE